MKMQKIELRNLIPSEGRVLTNGTDYCDHEKGIYLGVNDSPDNWWEISQDEYEAIMLQRRETE